MPPPVPPMAPPGINLPQPFLTDAYLRTYPGVYPTIQRHKDTGVASLPIAGSKEAPHTFKGNYTKIKDFIRHYERLCDIKLIHDDRDRIANIGQYCVERVRLVLEGLPSFLGNDWDLFKDEFMKAYDSERADPKFRQHDLLKYVKRTRAEPAFEKIEKWHKYNRGFIRIAGSLLRHQKMSAREVDLYFWKGIPVTLRKEIEQRILLNQPHHNFQIPFRANDVRKAAEQLLQRTKIEQEILPSDDERSSRRNARMSDSDSESSDSSSSSSSSSSSLSDSSDEEKATRRKKSDNSSKHSGKSSHHSKHHSHKEKSAKPTKSTSSRKDPEIGFTPLPAAGKSADSPALGKTKGDTDVNILIDKLAKMSLTDPAYPSLYLAAVQQSPYVQIVLDSIHQQRALQAQVMGMPTNSSQPPQQSMQSFRSQPRNRVPAEEREHPRFLDQKDAMCYGCEGTGHQMGNCPEIAKLISAGIVHRQVGGRLHWNHTENAVRRLNGEPWVEAIKRQSPVPVPGNFAVIEEYTDESEDDSQSYYNEEYYEDTEYQDFHQGYLGEVEEDEYESDYEDYAETFAATRPERNIRTNRKEQFEGVVLPSKKETEQRRAVRTGNPNEPQLVRAGPGRSAPGYQPNNSTPNGPRPPFQVNQPQQANNTPAKPVLAPANGPRAF